MKWLKALVTPKTDETGLAKCGGDSKSVPGTIRLNVLPRSCKKCRFAIELSEISDHLFEVLERITKRGQKT
jgi:hypothetical protein